MKQNGNKMETNGNQNELKVKIIFNETKWKQNGNQNNQNNQNELKVKINKILLFQFLSILYIKKSIL